MYWGELAGLLTVLGLILGALQTFFNYKVMSKVNELISKEKEKLESKLFTYIKEAKAETRKDLKELKEKVHNVEVDYLQKEEFVLFRTELNGKIDHLEKEIKDNVESKLDKIWDKIK